MSTHQNDPIDRLLRSAARSREELPVSPPFGFETRVVASWRSGEKKPNGLSALIRHVALVSGVIIVVVAVAGFREFSQSREVDESFSNEFAIADSAIQSEFGQ
jgi:hypothetical protein